MPEHAEAPPAADPFLKQSSELSTHPVHPTTGSQNSPVKQSKSLKQSGVPEALTAHSPLSTLQALSFPHVFGVHASGDDAMQRKIVPPSGEVSLGPPQSSWSGQSLATSQPHCPSNRQ